MRRAVRRSAKSAEAHTRTPSGWVKRYRRAKAHEATALRCTSSCPHLGGPGPVVGGRALACVTVHAEHPGPAPCTPSIGRAALSRYEYGDRARADRPAESLVDRDVLALEGPTLLRRDPLVERQRAKQRVQLVGGLLHQRRHGRDLHVAEQTGGLRSRDVVASQPRPHLGDVPAALLRSGNGGGQISVDGPGRGDLRSDPARPARSISWSPMLRSCRSPQCWRSASVPPGTRTRAAFCQLTYGSIQ